MSKVYTAEELRTRTAKAPLDLDIYKRAASAGMSLTAFLEQTDTSEPDDTMDAFERQMAVAGIRTQSDHARGQFADKVERFYASNQPISVVLFPEFINRTVRAAAVAQDFLSVLVAVRTPIDSDTYRSIYLDMSDITQFQMKRTSEGAEIPTARVLTSEHTIDLQKYGLRLLASYEAIRRMRLDMLQIHLGQIALRTALDKQGQAVAILVNGDGNNNAATNYNTSTIDSTATTTMTYKAWIGWLMKFYPYQCNVVLGNSAAILKILTMTFPSMDPLALLALMGNTAGGIPTRVELQPGIFTNVTLLLNDAIPDNTYVGIDNRFALEEVYEAGSDLIETDKIIARQLDEIVISEVVGYAIIYKEAVSTLTIA